MEHFLITMRTVSYDKQLPSSIGGYSNGSKYVVLLADIPLPCVSGIYKSPVYRESGIVDFGFYLGAVVPDAEIQCLVQNNTTIRLSTRAEPRNLFSPITFGVHSVFSNRRTL